MAIKITLKNSVVQDSVPSTSHLAAVGELALNANINSLGIYMRASDYSIVKMAGPGSVTTPAASTTVAGIAELATSGETTTGTDTARVTTPAGVKAVTDAERTTSNNTYLAKAGGTLTGVLAATAGSNSAASIHFGDTDSGLFGGTNTVSLTAGGTTRLTADTGVSVVGTLAVTGAITSTSNLTIADKIIHAGDTDTAIRFPGADKVSIETGGSERVRIDASGRLLVGHTSTITVGSTSLAALQSHGTTGAAGINLARFSANSTPPALNFGKARGASVGTMTIVNDGDDLGDINFSGADGVNLATISARIRGTVDGTPAADDIPGRLEFYTFNAATDTLTEQFRIKNDGGHIIQAGTLTINSGTTDTGLTLNSSDGNNNLKFNDDTGSSWIQNSSGNLVFNSDADNDIASSTMRFQIDNSEKARLTHAGQLLINTTTARPVAGTSQSLFQIEEVDATAGLSLVRNSANASPPYLRFGKSRSSSVGGVTTVVDNDVLGSIKFSAADGTDLESTSAVIQCRVMGTVAGNRTPGSLEFFTTKDEAGAVATTQALTITSAQKVGIGTDVPDNLLHLHESSTTQTAQVDSQLVLEKNADSGISILSGYTSNGRIYFGDSGDNDIGKIDYDHNDNSLGFTVNAAERMHITSAGDVGIGTASPGRQLELASTAPIIRLNETAGGYSEISANAAMLSLRADAGNTESNTYINFMLDGAEKGRITAEGRLLLNATSGASSNLLYIENPTNNNGILLRQTGHNYCTIWGDANRTTTDAYLLKIGGQWDGTAVAHFQFESGNDTDNKDDGRMSFHTASAGTPLERLRIEPDGDIGIGTTSPQQPIHLSKGSAVVRVESTNATTSARVEIKSADDTYCGLHFGDAADIDNGAIRYYHTSQFMNFVTDGSERMRLNSDGRLLIGTTANIDSNSLVIDGAVNGKGIIMRQTDDDYSAITSDANRSANDNAILYLRGKWNGTEVSRIGLESGDDTTNKDNGIIKFYTAAAGTVAECGEFDENGTFKLLGPAVNKVLCDIYPTNAQTEASLRIKSNCNAGCSNIIQFFDEDTTIATGKAIGKIDFYSSDSSGDGAGVKVSIQGRGHDTAPDGDFVVQTHHTGDGLRDVLKVNDDGNCYLPYVSSGTGTNVIINTSGALLKETSSKRYKKNIKTIEDSMADNILNCRPVWFQKNEDSDDSLGHFGFIAEEVHEVDPTFVVYLDQEKVIDENGKVTYKDLPEDKHLPDSVKYTNFIPLLLNLVKRQDARIKALEAK